ncbi:hypothetical protein LIA77_08970 [Sarocladium implicatum]|nr:hypothetical protein LIA77_08970 [Sarocladium implicatum]
MPTIPSLHHSIPAFASLPTPLLRTYHLFPVPSDSGCRPAHPSLRPAQLSLTSDR